MQLAELLTRAEMLKKTVDSQNLSQSSSQTNSATVTGPTGTLSQPQGSQRGTGASGVI